MGIRKIVTCALFCAFFSLATPASSLTMTEFANICNSNQVPCREHPILIAYVGGALDLMAMLDEETDYLDEVYCKSPKALFKVPVIIDYMESQQAEYANKNAMLVLIRYLEQRGGC